MKTACKQFDFGKVAYSSDKRANQVYVNVEIKYKDSVIHWSTGEMLHNAPVISISGEIWDVFKNDLECGGQCLDTIRDYLPINESFNFLYGVWKNYHLNDMCAGTEKQTAAVTIWKNDGNVYDYSKAYDHLKSMGLHFDGFYKYGSNWLYKPVPNDVLTKLLHLMK